MSFRDLKRQARRDLHSELRVPAYYVPTPSDDPVLLHVRLHYKFDTIGKLPGSDLPYAEKQEVQPRIIFMRDELEENSLALARGAVIVFEADEAYRIDNINQPDDISITAECLRLRGDQLTGLPVPPDDAE